MTPLNIYLWQTADKLLMASVVTTVILGSVFVFGMSFFSSEGSRLKKEEAAFVVKTLKLLGALTFISFASAILIPSSKTIALMYVLPEIANSKVMQQDVPELYDMAVKALKDQLSSKE